MAAPVYIDTTKLRFYQDAPDNYCHFVLGNLFEVFIGLHERGLLGADIELIHNNVGANFSQLYSVFTEGVVRRQSSFPADARIITLEPAADWTKLESRPDLDFYLESFRKFIWSRVLSETPAAPTQVTLIQRHLIASNRYVINEALLARRLACACRANGLELVVVDFDGMTFAAQVEMMSRTRILIGIHGAGLVNAMFLPPEAAVIELLPHRLFQALFFRKMGLDKGNEWIRVVEPSWSVPSLYNLFLAATRRGFTKRNRFYRDRSAVFEPDSMLRAFAHARAFDNSSGKPNGIDVMLEPRERAPLRRLKLVATHRKLLLVMLGVVIAAPFFYPAAAFWFIAPALIATAFFV
jgi:hypothetical protein